MSTPTPPDAETVTEPLALLQLEDKALALTLIALGCVTFPEAVTVQPLASVTVTV